MLLVHPAHLRILSLSYDGPWSVGDGGLADADRGEADPSDLVGRRGDAHAEDAACDPQPVVSIVLRLERCNGRQWAHHLWFPTRTFVRPVLKTLDDIALGQHADLLTALELRPHCRLAASPSGNLSDTKRSKATIHVVKARCKAEKEEQTVRTDLAHGPVGRHHRLLLDGQLLQGERLWRLHFAPRFCVQKVTARRQS